MYDFSSLSFFLSFFLSRRSPLKNLSLSTSAVFSRDATEKNGRRPQRWRDVRDSRRGFLSRVPFFFSFLSLSLFVRVAFICAIFLRPFFLRIWVAFCCLVSTGGCDVGLREGRKRAQKRASRRRVWTRIDENARKKSGARGFRAERSTEGGRTRVRVRVRATDFLVLGGPVFEAPGMKHDPSSSP